MLLRVRKVVFAHVFSLSIISRFGLFDIAAQLNLFADFIFLVIEPKHRLAFLLFSHLCKSYCYFSAIFTNI